MKHKHNNTITDYFLTDKFVAETIMHLLINRSYRMYNRRKYSIIYQL